MQRISYETTLLFTVTGHMLWQGERGRVVARRFDANAMRAEGWSRHVTRTPVFAAVAGGSGLAPASAALARVAADATTSSRQASAAKVIRKPAACAITPMVDGATRMPE